MQSTKDIPNKYGKPYERIKVKKSNLNLIRIRLILVNVNFVFNSCHMTVSENVQNLRYYINFYTKYPENNKICGFPTLEFTLPEVYCRELTKSNFIRKCI
jgi:hypothetical protein